MNKYKKLLLLTLALLALLAGFLFFKPKSQKPPPQTQEVKQDLKTTLTVDASPFVGKTALEATKSSAQIEESGTGENAFVTSINGRLADSNKHEFWELDINGKPAEVGAGSYIIWKLSTY